MTSAETPPQLQIDGRVATITLNRPQFRHRLHNEDVRTLIAHCQTLHELRDVRVVILTSQQADSLTAGKSVFCAGFHVGDFDGPEPVIPFEQLPDAIQALEAVTICAMPGSVYGGATDVALACDFRLGIHGMQLRMPAAALGLHYYPSGLARYVSKLGVNVAKKAFLTAKTWSAQELLQIGYLDELLSPDALMTRAYQLAHSIAELAPMAVSGMKQSIQNLADAGIDEAVLNNIRAREQACALSADFEEGRKAFAQKRQPDFKGI